MASDLLSGVRILDLTKATSGPFGCQMLADLGADVIKIEEPPVGAHKRDVLTPQFTIDGMDPLFLCVNRSKRSVAIRLGDPDGLALFMELVAKVDVVADNFRPGVTTKLGIDHAALAAVNPRIITCSLSGYGATGPLRRRAGFDITVQAETGMTIFNDKHDASGTPQAVSTPMADLVAGMYLATAIPAALHRRTETGEGCHVDVAMYDALLSWHVGLGVHELNFGSPSTVSSNLLWGTFDTKDRPMVITAHRASQFQRFCVALEHPEWLEDERFSEPAARSKNFDTLRAIVVEVLKTRTAAEWVARFEETGCSYGEIRSMQEAFDHPHTAAREMVVEVESHRGSPIRLFGNPIKVDGMEQRYTAPPEPGQHTVAVLSELLGYSDEQLADAQAKGVIFTGEE